MDVEKLLADWDTHRTFEELPYRHLMSECMVTVDEPVKRKNLDELINGVRNKINSGIKNVRRSFEKER